MKHYPVIRKISNLLIPPILLFGLYVQFHGDFGPGGGFQAGVIFAAGVILFALLYGLKRAQTMFRPETVKLLAAAGVLIYAGTGIISIIGGGNYLDYYALAPGHEIPTSDHPSHERSPEAPHHDDHASDQHPKLHSEHHGEHAHHPGQHWGIFTVELGVGITVAAAMLTIFYAFASRGQLL